MRRTGLFPDRRGGASPGEVRTFEVDDDISDPDLVSVEKRVMIDILPVDLSAICTLQIDESIAPTDPTDVAVLTTGHVIADLDGVLAGAAECDDLFGQIECEFAFFVSNGDAGHADLDAIIYGGSFVGG